jgi:chromosome segregation ATPase
MTDDIVTRLAKSACVGCYECVCGMCDLLAEAADEIKRLRSAMDAEGNEANLLMLEIERLRAELKDADNDFHALKEMFDRMRVDRDLWKEVAENLASELGKKEYAHAEYDTCKEAAEGVAW